MPIDVRMPDGQIIKNVPDDIDQETLLKNYSSHLASQPQKQEASVFEAMKKGFGQALSRENMEDIARQAGPMATARMVAPIEFAAGAAKLPANVLNLAGISQPLQAVNQANQLSKGMIEAGDAKSLLPGISNLAGEIGTGAGALSSIAKAAGPIQSLMPSSKLAIEAIKNSPLSQAVLGGATLGAAGSESLSPMNIAKEAGLGGLFGGAGYGAAKTFGHLMDPELLRLAKLKATGISDDVINKLSSGQMLGGIAQKIENVFQDLPFGGAKGFIRQGKTALDEAAEGNAKLLKSANEIENINATRELEDAAKAAKRALPPEIDELKLAQNQFERSFYKPMIERSLKNLEGHVKIDGKPFSINDIPKDLQGTDLMNYAQKLVSLGYNTSLPQIKGIRVTKDVKENLNKSLEKYNLRAEDYNDLSKDIERLVETTNKGGWIDSQSWQNELSQLSQNAHSLLTKPNALPSERRYGMALDELHDTWMKLIQDKAGSKAFEAANKAFSSLQAPQQASSYVKNVAIGGGADPKDILQAIKSGTSAKRFAGGEDELQKIATEAHKKILAERDQLKETITGKKESLEDTLKEDQRKLEDIKLAKNKAVTEKTENFQKVVNEAKDMAHPDDYVMKRLGYGLGLGTGIGGPIAANLIGLSPYGIAPIAGAAYGISRGIYNPISQALIKKGATLERPEQIKQLGSVLKQNAPLAGLTAVESMQQHRQNPIYRGSNVTISSPDTAEEVIPPQGGLPVPK